MYPDPSIRIRWTGEVASGAALGAGSATAWSVLAAVARSLVQHVEPRAIGAHHLLLHDPQEHARVAERAVAAVAGHGALVHMDDLGRCLVVRAVQHEFSM